MKQYDTKTFENGSTKETGLDNRPTVGSESEHLSLGTGTQRDGIYQTVQASNTAGSGSPVLMAEERKELESEVIAKNQSDGIPESVSQGKYGAENEASGRMEENAAECRARIEETLRNAQAN